MQSFATAFKDKSNRDIIKALYYYGEMSIDELSQKLGDNAHSLYRHINILTDSRILHTARSNGKSLYFKLNPEYFQILSEKLDDFFPTES